MWKIYLKETENEQKQFIKWAPREIVKFYEKVQREYSNKIEK